MAEILQVGKRDTTGQLAAWTITDWTDDRSLDCNTENTLTNLCNNFGTLIKQLIQAGILNGTVTAA